MRTRLIKILLVWSTAVLCVAVTLPLTAHNQPASAQAQEKKDYSRFTHQTHADLTGKTNAKLTEITKTVKVPGTNQTRELKCDSCHTRSTPNGAATPTPAPVPARNQQLQLKFPGHNACIECHIIQFTSRPLQTCTICHNQDQGLTQNPPQREFPARTDFDAFFDREQHQKHDGYKLQDGQKLNCTFCHKATPKEAARTMSSHPECYVCHTPKSWDQKASLKSDCAVCHRLPTKPEEKEPYSARYSSRAYGAHFSHRTHIGYVNGDCLKCHTISGDYNQPAPSSIQVVGHKADAQRNGRGCFSCHDDVKQYNGHAIFGEKSADKCSKCHTRPNNKIVKEEG